MLGQSLPPIRITHPHVTEHPSLGMLVIGTRIPVRRLWRWHRRGVSVATLIARYPKLKPAAILDALSFAHDNEERIEAELAREQEFLDTELGRVVGGQLQDEPALATSDRSDVSFVRRRCMPFTYFAWL